MSYRPPFFFNTQQLSQSQQTSPGQQQSQQPQPLVQSSPTVASYQAPLPAVAPWHQHQQQTVYRSDIGTKYVYDNANQTSISANRTAISVNPTSHLSMTDSLQTTPNRQGQTVGNVSSSVISTPPPMASGDISLSTPVSKSVCPNVSTSPKEEEMFYLAIPQSHMNRAEVKSLLAEGEDRKDLSPIKSELTDVPVQEQEETVESSMISTTGPILDPSVVPEGQGLVDG